MPSLSGSNARSRSVICPRSDWNYQVNFISSVRCQMDALKFLFCWFSIDNRRRTVENQLVVCDKKENCGLFGVFGDDEAV